MLSDMPESNEGANPTGSEEQQPLAEGSYKVEDVFRQIKGAVKKDHDYFIGKPPEPKKFSESELVDLESKKPFFLVNLDKKVFETNKEVIPFVWDQKLGSRDERFSNAEKLTKGDSGLVALAAVSSETPEEQAEVYRILTSTILQVHENNPKLIGEWLRAQLNNRDYNLTSMYVFHSNDVERGKENGSPNDTLLPYKVDSPMPDSSVALLLWKPRIDELKSSLSQDQLQPHHLRWIEFLSHSVNVPEIIKEIQKASVAAGEPKEEAPKPPFEPQPSASEEGAQASFRRDLQVLASRALMEDPRQFENLIRFPLTRDALTKEEREGIDELEKKFQEKYQNYPGSTEEERQIKEYLGQGEGSDWQYYTERRYRQLFHGGAFDEEKWRQVALLVREELVIARLKKYQEGIRESGVRGILQELREVSQAHQRRVNELLESIGLGEKK